MVETAVFETFGYENFGYEAVVSEFVMFGALGEKGPGKTLTSRKLEVLRSLP
ncbi:hypothetical protein [Streptomyces sp. IBSBF 2806]|uniref:hypothetical protein n=1 Tax=Streptomyces sp. IBSBF 2806 TaxID=2903529 RepID=UPI002FDBB03B